MMSFGYSIVIQLMLQAMLGLRPSATGAHIALGMLPVKLLGYLPWLASERMYLQPSRDRGDIQVLNGHLHRKIFELSG